MDKTTRLLTVSVFMCMACDSGARGTDTTLVLSAHGTSLVGSLTVCSRHSKDLSKLLPDAKKPGPKGLLRHDAVLLVAADGRAVFSRPSVCDEPIFWARVDYIDETGNVLVALRLEADSEEEIGYGRRLFEGAIRTMFVDKGYIPVTGSVGQDMASVSIEVQADENRTILTVRQTLKGDNFCAIVAPVKADSALPGRHCPSAVIERHALIANKHYLLVLSPSIGVDWEGHPGACVLVAHMVVIDMVDTFSVTVNGVGAPLCAESKGRKTNSTSR